MFNWYSFHSCQYALYLKCLISSLTKYPRDMYYLWILGFSKCTTSVIWYSDVKKKRKTGNILSAGTPMWQHTAVGGRALRHGSWKAEGQRKVGSASLTDYGQPPGSPVTGGLLWCKWDASSSWEACEVLWAPFRAAHSCSVHSCSQTVNAPLTLSIKHALLFPAFLLLSLLGPCRLWKDCPSQCLSISRDSKQLQHLPHACQPIQSPHCLHYWISSSFGLSHPTIRLP